MPALMIADGNGVAGFVELVPYVESDLERFVKAVLLDLDAAGALADYLDEIDGPTAPYLSGKPSPSRGELLRRRWEMWKRERAEAEVIPPAMIELATRLGRCQIAGIENRWVIQHRTVSDIRFKAYIRRKLGVKWATSRNFF